MGNGKQGADAGWAVFAKLGGVERLDFLHVAAPSVVGEGGNRVPYGLDIGGDGVADLGLAGHGFGLDCVFAAERLNRYGC